MLKRTANEAPTKGKAPTLKEKLKSLDNIKDQINKRYGANVVYNGVEAQKAGILKKQILRTPSEELNKALYGGLGGIVDLFGPESSGKTSLAIEVLAKAQKEDPNFVGAWFETEDSITQDILALHGVDLSRLVYWDQKGAGNAENSLDIARAYIASGDINLLIVNSVAGLSSKVEQESDMEKQNPAVIARIMSKFFRTIVSIMDLSKTTIIFINQERDNVGQMFGNPSQATGGKALKFYSFQRIRMSRLKIMAADPIKDEEGIKVGFNIYKNRFAQNNPYLKGEFYARYDTGIDSYIAIPSKLVEAGIITKKGAWHYYYGPNDEIMKIGGVECKFSSNNNFIEALRNNEELFRYFTSMLSGRAVDETELEAIKKDEQEAEEFNKQFGSEMASDGE